MSFADRFDQLMGSKLQEQKTQSPNDQSQKTTGGGFGDRFRQLMDDALGKNKTSGLDFNQGVGMYNTTIDSFSKWYDESMAGLSEMGRDNINLTETNEMAGYYLRRAGALRQWANENKDLLGDNYQDIMDSLQQVTTATYWMDRGYKNRADELLTKFETVEEYDQYMADEANRDHWTSYDIVNAYDERQKMQAPIDVLRSDYNDLYELEGAYGLLANDAVPEEERQRNQARYDEIVSRYGEGITAEDLYYQLQQLEGEYGGRIAQLDAEIAEASKYQGQSGEGPWDESKPKTAADYEAELEQLNASIASMSNYIDVLDARYAELDAAIANYSSSSDPEDHRRLATAQSELSTLLDQLNGAQQDYDSMMSQKWQLEKNLQYDTLSENADFASNNGYSVEFADDFLYRYINNRDGITSFLQPGEKHDADAWFIGENADKYGKYNNMTPEEVKNYNYLRRTQGAAAAYEYLLYLEPQMDARFTENIVNDIAGMTKSGIGGAVVANALSVPLTLVGGIGYLDIAAQNLGRKVTGSYAPINYNSAAMLPTHMSRAVRQTTAGMITDRFGTIQLDPEKNPFWAKILNGRGLADVYQLGMSAIDSKVAALTGHPAAAMALMATSAATQGVLDALDRGATDDQALQMGMWNGLFEAIFEFIEVENLLKGDDNWIRAILNQAITEGLGEGFTSIANNIADVIVMADKSEIMKAAAEYRGSGMDKDQALWNAIADAAIAVGWDIVGGAASGAMSVGGIAVTNTISQRMQHNKFPADMKASVKRLEGYGIDRNEAARISSILYERGSDYGKNANAFILGYVPGQDVAQYSVDFKTAYEIGKNNGNKEYLGKLSLNEAQQKIAYELGAAESRKASQEAKAPEVKEEELAYSVSDDGATIDSTGKKVTVKGFSSVGSKVTLELEGGKTIDAKEVSFGTADEAILYETIGQVAGAASTANRILESYETAAKEGMSASDFAAGLRQAYDLGVSGQVAERQLGTYELAGKLPMAARSAAFSRGRAVGQYNATARQAVLEARGRQVQGKRKGTFHFDRKGRTFDSKRESSLKAMEALSKALGIDIYVYESYKEGGKRVYQDRGGKVKKAPNGFYDAQGIHIDLNAGNFGQGTMMFTVAHELTHFIKEWSPVKFRKLADLLVERYAEQGTSVRDLIDRQIVKAKKNGRTIDRDTAFEEVVADSMETMLTRGDIGQFMAELKQQDRSLRQKIADWFKDLAQKLQAVVEQYKGAKPETAEGQLVAQMEDFIQVLRQAYAEALVEAGENYRASEGKKNTTQEGGEEKFSIRRTMKMSLKDQLKEYYKRLFFRSDSFYFGITPSVLKRSGIDALPLAMGQDDFKKSTVLKHNIPRRVLLNIQNDLSHPLFSFTAGNQSGIMTSDIDGDGKPVVVAIHGGHNMDRKPVNLMKSIYGVESVGEWVADQINSGAKFRVYDVEKTIAMLQTEGYLAEVGADGDGSWDIITPIDPGVNPETAEKRSDRDSSGNALTQEQQAFFRDSVVRDAQGRLMIMYHGTSRGGFTVFDTYYGNHGLFGIGSYFTSDLDIAESYTNKGRGKNKQVYKAYLNVTHPIDMDAVADVKHWEKAFPDVEFPASGTNEEMFRAVERFCEYEMLPRDEAADMIRDGIQYSMGYDAITHMGGGRVNSEGVRHRVYIVFEPEQVKSVDNRKPTENPDILLSERDAGAEKVVQALEEQNAKLKEDVKDLRELLRMQGKLTHGQEFKKSSIDAAVKGLAKEAMATLDAEDRKQLHEMLKDFYKFIATDKELAWEGVMEKAGRIADFLQERVNIKPQRDGYADEVLRQIRGTKVRLSDSQRAEVEKLYGYETYRRMLFGAGVYLSKDGMALDSFWHELNTDLPGTFADDVNEGDQPAELLRIIEAMREGDDSMAMEYAYNHEAIRQGLIRAVYDSYWRVDNLTTVADKKQKQIDAIRKEHRERMDALKEDQKYTLEKFRVIRENVLYTVRTEYEAGTYAPVKMIEDAWKTDRKRAIGEFRQIENTFIRMAKDFEKFGQQRLKERAKDQKGFEKEQERSRKQFEKQLKAEAAKHEKDNALWTREFERLLKEYDKSGQKIERLEQRYKTREENLAASHQRSVVEKAAKDLMDMLSRPTKEAHVPMALQAPLEKFVNSIDFSSKRALEGGELTIKDVAYTRALQEVKTAIAQQRTALEGAADGTFSLDVPKEFLDMIEQHINLINKATEGLDLTTGRVYEMTSDELKDLAFILKTINKAIRDIDKLHMAGAKARVSELSKSTVWEMGRRKAVKTEDGGWFMWRNYTPTFAFERMGTAATQVLNGLKMGQAKLARTAASVIKFTEDTYTNKEVNEWEEKVHEVELDSGKTVKMTTSQIMSFYCLSRREQAKGHLNGGGIRMGNIGEGRKMIRQTDHFQLTQEDIARINGLLTDRQRKVANKLQRYMADVGGRLGNEISMARWDYMEMTDRDYFPIRSDSDVHDAKNPDQDKTNLWALLNKSFTKQVTPGANDAMIVSSIFDVFADHMSDMAEYNAFALPLVDAMKWYNYRETEKQENGQIKTIGVKKSINDKLGTAAGEYFIDLMTDINSSQKAGRYEDFFGKLLGRSKAASVGWNLRVAIQQPTAILRASVYLDLRSLVKGTARLGMKQSVEEMKKYSGIALWKSLGYYDLNISRGIRDQIKGDTTLLDKINDAGMWLPGKVDEQTWARIWESCKEQVRRQQKLSGERLLEETAKLFEDVVYHTQVADSVLTRSGLMRSKSQTMKEWTSFMAEPTLSVNLLMNAFQDYREGVSKGEKAKRTMKILFCGYVLSAIANAIATSFMDAFRDDDEYEGYWDKFFQALLGEKLIDGSLFAELNPLEKIVFVRDVFSLLRGYEGTKNPFVELTENGIKLVQNIVKFFQGKGSLTAYGLIYQSLQVLGGFTGAAPANLMREATTIWNWTFGKWNNMTIHRYKTSPKESIRNAYESGAITKAEARDALVASGETIADAYYMIKGWDVGEKVGVYDEVYSAALAGKDISAAVAEAVKHGEKTEKEVLSQLRKQIKKWYTDPESDTKITREQAQEMVDSYLGLDPEESAALVEEWTFELENGYSYDDIKHTYLDNEITAAEAKRVLIDRLGKTEKEADRRIQYWDYLRENRDSELTEYQVADFYEYAEPAGISKSVYEKYINDTKGIEGEGTKARKMEVIDSLPLSAKQKDALYFAEGWAKSSLLDAPWHQ